MSTNIQLLRSSIPNKRPAPGTLLDGQAAVNLNSTDPGLFFKLSNGNLTKIGPVSVNSSGSAPNSTPSGSAGNAVGETWMDGRAAYAAPILKVYDGASWNTANGFLVNSTGDFSLTKTLTVSTLEADGLGNSSYIRVPQDTTLGRPTGASGMFRFNTTDVGFEGFNGTNWVSFLTSDLENLTLNGFLVVRGDTTLGDSCSADTVTIQGALTVKCDSTFEENIQVTDNKTVKFNASTGANYVGFKAPTTIAAALTWTLPGTDGSNGQVLTTNGTGTLYWTTAASGFVFNQDIIPTQDNAFDIGSPAFRVANFYTGDLHLANERGNWTMIEENDYLSLRDNKTGKVYKLLMQEVA